MECSSEIDVREQFLQLRFGFSEGEITLFVCISEHDHQHVQVQSLSRLTLLILHLKGHHSMLNWLSGICDDLVVFGTTSKFGDLSFICSDRTYNAWNSLLQAIEDSKSVDIFKSKLKTHLFGLSFHSLCISYCHSTFVFEYTVLWCHINSRVNKESKSNNYL